MSVPTREEIIQALRIPVVETKFDSLGRVVRKKNYNTSSKPSKASKVIYKMVPTSEVIRIRGHLYNR